MQCIYFLRSNISEEMILDMETIELRARSHHDIWIKDIYNNYAEIDFDNNGRVSLLVQHKGNNVNHMLYQFVVNFQAQVLAEWTYKSLALDTLINIPKRISNNQQLVDEAFKEETSFFFAELIRQKESGAFQLYQDITPQLLIDEFLELANASGDFPFQEDIDDLPF